MEPCSCMQCMTGRREGVLIRYILYIIYMWIWLHVNIVASGMWKFDGIIVLLCSYPSQLRTHICSSLTKKVALSALWMLIHSQGAPCSSRLRHPAIYDIFAWGKCECTRRVMTSIHMWGRWGGGCLDEAGLGRRITLSGKQIYTASQPVEAVQCSKQQKKRRKREENKDSNSKIYIIPICLASTIWED